MEKRLRRYSLVLTALLLTTSALLAADWPMLGHDAQRTGSTAEEIKPPLQRAWLRYFWTEGLMPTVQPIVVDGKLYLGTMAGKLYAIDAATGEDLWVAETPAGVSGAACMTEGGIVAVPCLDGSLAAFNANDGKPAWALKTPVALWTSPLAIGERIFLAGRDGVFYALDATTGEKAWSTDIGAPMCQSPAVSKDDKTLYIMAEDCRVRALSVADGEIAWVSEQLPGTTARGFHPVVAPDGSVMVNTNPFYSWNRSHEPLDNVMAEIFGTEELGEAETKYPGTYTLVTDWRHTKQGNERLDKHTREIFLKDDYFQRMLAGLEKEVAADPAIRCLFVLDPASGKEKYMLPVLHTAFAKSQFTPPMVTPEGRVITKWWAFLPSTYNAYQRDVNLAELDTTTGELAPVFNESRINSDHGLGLIADESCQMSIGGRYLWNLANHHGEMFNWFDLADEDRSRTGKAYTTNSHSYGEGIIHRLVRNQVEQIDATQEDLPRGFGVGIPGEHCAGNHNAANMPLVIAAGKVFYCGGGKLMALEPAEKAPADNNRGRSLETFNIAPLSDAEVETITETFPVNWDYCHDPGSKDPVAYYPEGLPFPAGTLQNPDAENAKQAAKVTDEQLDAIIFSTQEPGQLPDSPLAKALEARLTAAVEEYISQPLWRPYIFMGGKHPTYHLEFYVDPADGIEALAWAYPFLPEATQAKVVEYVKAEWFKKNPIIQNTRYDRWAGEPRERHAIKDGYEMRVETFLRNRGPERAYPAWLWVHRTGQDDMLADAIYENLLGATGLPKDNSKRGARDWSNARASALIAACRMAKDRDDQIGLDKLLPVTREALRERLAITLTYHRGRVAEYQIGIWKGYPRWTWLTPELGRLIREHAGETGPKLVSYYIDWLRPNGFLTRGPLSPASHENSMQLPTNPLATFQAKAWIQGASAEELAPLVDLPMGKADPYYIQKLAVALQALSGPTWQAMD